MKRKLLAPCALLLSVSMLCSCGGGKNSKKADIDLTNYPIDTDVELTYWLSLSSNLASVASDLGETEFSKELEKRTGVKVKYIHPPVGQESESFNLMIASNELPDIVEYNWANALGGPTNAINDQVIIPLNDYMEEYAPNLSKYLQDNPEIDKMIKTDDKQYYAFPFIRGDKSLLISSGLIIRRDWLNDLGLELPETIQDWEYTLEQFRDKKGATAPFTMANNWTMRILYNMFSASNNFYIDNGKIKYGPLEPEYKEAVVTLNRWFENGLLDKNYVSVDGTIQDANMLNGKSGATISTGGSGIGRWLETMKEKDPKFDLAGVKMPIVNENTVPRFAPFELEYPMSGCAAITTASKNPELAAKFLDYAYSEDGHNLYNFGIEGKSFNYVDGYPKYTDTITKNSEGLTMNQAMAMYMRSHIAGPYINDKRYLEQYYQMPQQKEALDQWLTYYDEATKTLIPAVSLTPEESQEYANIVNEINKYRDTMTASFISGIEPLSKYDEFIAQIKDLKIDRAIEIQQAAYDRYISR